MILKPKYEKGGAEARVEIAKSVDSGNGNSRWEVEITIRGFAKDVDDAARQALVLARTMAFEKPTGHKYDCDCMLCKMWKEEDAKRRLDSK